MNQTITTEQMREAHRRQFSEMEHKTVRALRLQKERIIHEQESAKWEAANKMHAEHLREEIRKLGHEPEA